MKLLGTIVTPGGVAYELLAPTDLPETQMVALADGLKAGKAVFFAPDIRLRPVPSMYGGLLTDEERADAEKRLSARGSWMKPTPGLPDGITLFADTPAVVEGRA